MSEPAAPLVVTARRAGLIVVIFLALQLAAGVALEIVTGVAALFRPAADPLLDGPTKLTLGNVFATGLTLFVELQRQRRPWRLLWTGPRLPSLLLLPAALALVAGCAVLGTYVDVALVRAFPPPALFNSLFADLGDLHANPISGPFALVAMAAVTEELVFRGLILRGLLQVTTPGRAIGLSAVLFAAMHVNPWQLPVGLSMGVLLGWLFHRTGSLGLCIVAHAFNNALFLLSPALAGDGEFMESGLALTQAAYPPAWAGLGAAAVFATGLAAALRLTSPPVVAVPPPPLPPPPLPRH